MKKVLAIGLLLCLLFVGCKNTQISDDNAGQTELTMEERAVNENSGAKQTEGVSMKLLMENVPYVEKKLHLRK